MKNNNALLAVAGVAAVVLFMNNRNNGGGAPGGAVQTQGSISALDLSSMLTMHQSRGFAGMSAPTVQKQPGDNVQASANIFGSATDWQGNPVPNWPFQVEWQIGRFVSGTFIPWEQLGLGISTSGFRVTTHTPQGMQNLPLSTVAYNIPQVPGLVGQVFDVEARIRAAQSDGDGNPLSTFTELDSSLTINAVTMVGGATQAQGSVAAIDLNQVFET